MRNNGKPVSPKKGGRFEVKVARLLGEWLYLDKKALYKSRGSGAMYTRGGSDIDIGDISPMKPNIYWPFCVECKAREVDCSFDVLIRNGKKSNLVKWFLKNEQEALDNNLFPLLIFKKNHLGEFVMFRWPSLKIPVDFENPKIPSLTIVYFGKGYEFYICELTSFVNSINSTIFMNSLKLKGYGLKKRKK